MYHNKHFQNSAIQTERGYFNIHIKFDRDLILFEALPD